MSEWNHNIERIHDRLKSLSVHDENAAALDPDAALLLWCKITLRIREARKTVYLIGNGASASIASHIAADLAKNANVHTEVFTDLSLITSIANDISFEEVYAEPLRRRMNPGDLLVAISSSGQSPNIIRAAQEAGRLGGTLVTLSAMNPQNALRSLGSLNFYVPARTYGIAETCHAAVLHFWIDNVIKMMD